MKKYYIALCAVCFGMAFTSCSNDDNEVVKNEGAPLTEIFASAKVASRTAVAENGVDVTWSAGDAISVFPLTGISGTKSFTFVQTGQAGQSSSKFFGKADECDKYVSVYPADTNIKYQTKGGEEGPSVSKITIPTDQHAVKGGFDPKASIMAATFTQATAGEVEFKHMCAFAKITTTQPCKSITFTPNLNPVVGVTGPEFYLQFKDGNVSNAHASMSVGKNYAKLIPASGQAEIEAGTYLIAFCPNETSGNPKFVIEISDNSKLQRQSSVSFTFNYSDLGKVYDFGTVDGNWTLVTE